MTEKITEREYNRRLNRINSDFYRRLRTYENPRVVMRGVTVVLDPYRHAAIIEGQGISLTLSLDQAQRLVKVLGAWLVADEIVDRGINELDELEVVYDD